MMKKITRIAALLATTALLLAGFPACGDDDDGEEPTPAAPVDTVSPDSFELTSGAEPAEKTFTLTLGTTQINEAGLAALKATADLTEQKATIVTQSEGDNITVSKIAVAEAATATTVKLSLTMASEAEGGTKGTLTLTLPADFTANSKAIEKTLSYEIKAAGNTDDDKDKPNPDDTSAFTSWTANLATISAGLSGEKDSSSPPKVTVDAEKTVDTAFIIYSPSARIRVRDDNTLNYNGGTKDAFATTTVNGTLTETLDRYVGVDTSKLTSSGNVKVTISVKAVNSSSATGDVGQVVLVDENNKILAYHGDVKIKTGNDTFDIDATVAAGSKVIVGFSRSGAGGGGIDVTALKAEAAN